VDLTAALVTFGIIFVAELPDKTLVASLVLGSRYRPAHVWVGAAAAFLVHVTLAVAVGSVFTLLPHRVVSAVVLALFLIGAVLVWREGGEEEAEAAAEEMTETADAAGEAIAGEGQPAPKGGAVATAAAGDRAATGFWRVAATAFTVIFLAEMGDLTQITTANLAARFSSPVAVWVGALLALWAVAALAIAGGRSLLRFIPVRLITRLAAMAFLVLAVFSLIDLIRG
jgi:putative Ca2+/H+ antiporter (TMEM165/GDT1 family)